jgi:uncharacterized C2H2 Zn-finger protein
MRDEPSGDGERDWFGNPSPGVGNRTVACPRCGADFSVSHDLAVHLRVEHHLEMRRAHDRIERARRWWSGLGFLPLLVVAPLDLLVVVLVVTTIWPHHRWLAVYAGLLATLPLVLVLSHRVFRPPT